MRDLLILVAALAPGFEVARRLPNFLGVDPSFTFIDTYYKDKNAPGSYGTSGRIIGGHIWTMNLAGRPLPRRLSYWLVHIPYWSGPCLVMGSFVVLMLGPGFWRAEGRRNLGRLEVIGTTAIVFAMSLTVAECGWLAVGRAQSWFDLWRYPGSLLGYFWWRFPGMAGYTVAVSWLTLVLCGRWAGEPSLRRDLGILLGWCWIAAALSGWIGGLCFALNY